MTNLLLRSFPVAALCVALLGPAPVEAQSKEYGFSLDAASLLSSSKLDAGDVFMYGGRLTIQPHAWAKLGIGMHYGAKGEVPEIRRPFKLWAPKIDLEGTLKGRDSRLYGVLSPTLLMFDLEELGGAPAERVLMPALGVGLGASIQVLGPVSVDVTAQDMMTWAPAGALRGVDGGARQFAHSPRIEARVSFSFRKRERIARFEDLPVSFSNSFEPLTARAGQHQEPVLQETGGREHVHPSDGVERRMEAPQEVRTAVEDILLGTVYFSSGASKVSSEFQSVIKDAAEYLKANPGVNVVIRGYTSQAGNPRYNLTLAERRATAVRDQLVSFYQISSHRIDATTGGIDPESSDVVARRVEIRTVKRVSR